MNSRFFEIFDPILSAKGLSINSGIVEKILLEKLAAVKSKPTSFDVIQSPIFAESTSTCFLIAGMNEEEADSFLNFFKTHGDENAIKEKDEENKYLFDVNSEILCDVIVPLFQENLEKISEESPEELEEYIQASEDEADLKVEELLELLEQIIKQTALLESNYVNTYVGGQLNIIFKWLTDKNILETLKFHVLHPECWVYEMCAKTFETVGELFENVYTKTETLQNDPVAKQLKQNIDTFKSSRLSSLGLFSNTIILDPERLEVHSDPDEILSAAPRM